MQAKKKKNDPASSIWEKLKYQESDEIRPRDATSRKRREVII